MEIKLRNVILFGMTLLLFTSCTCNKQAPQTQATAAKAVVDLRNDCEKVITLKDSELPNPAGSKILMVQQKPDLICEAHFFTPQKIQRNLYVVKNGQPKLIYKIAPEPHAECGVTGHKFDARVVELKFKNGPHSVLAVEVATAQTGCSGSPGKVKSKVFLYDLSTERRTGELTASDYCEADKSGGGKNSLCDPGDKKAVDKGVQVRFNWARCDKATPCDQVHFEKVEMGTQKKPTSFVLKWDESLNLKTATF